MNNLSYNNNYIINNCYYCLKVLFLKRKKCIIYAHRYLFSLPRSLGNHISKRSKYKCVISYLWVNHYLEIE